MKPPEYLKVIPAEVPAGQVVVHNTVRPTRRLGSRGFRAWLAPLEERTAGRLTVCDCGWAPELGTHYRVSRNDEASEQEQHAD